MALDESQLIDAAVRGNADAFGELVKLHQDRLYNAMVHVVGNRAEAEDVVQEAFVRAFLRLNTFQQGSAFYTWLYRIAFNRAVSRSRKKRPKTSVDDARERTGDEPIDDGDAPEERLLREERCHQIQAALASLGEEHRAVLVLREIEGCDYETIGQILDLNVGTVRSRLHRARLQLKEELERVMMRE